MISSIDASNYDSRYSVRCGEHVFVFDTERGIGAVPNNAEVRYRGAVVLMSPAKFLRIAMPFRAHGGDAMRSKSINFLSKAMSEKPLGPPQLMFGTSDSMQSGEWICIGHEGRHRMTVLREAGCALIPTQITFAKDMGSGPDIRARSITPAMLEFVRKGVWDEYTSDQMRMGKFVDGPLFDVAFVDSKKYVWSER